MKQSITNMIQKYFNGDVREKLQKHAEQIGLKGQEAIDIITLTKDTVKEVLQAELKNGQYTTVVSFLRSSSFQLGKNLVVDKIIQRVVGRLIIRFGLPGSIALSLATLLVPFILKRISQKALKSGKVQDLFLSLGLNDKIERWSVLKNQVIDKFRSPDREAA